MSETRLEAKTTSVEFIRRTSVPLVVDSPIVQYEREKKEADSSFESKSAAENIFICNAVVHSEDHSDKTYTFEIKNFAQLDPAYDPSKSTTYYLTPFNKEKPEGKLINQVNIVTLWQLQKFQTTRHKGRRGESTRVTLHAFLSVYNIKTETFNGLFIDKENLQEYTIKPLKNSNQFILIRDCEDEISADLVEITSSGLSLVYLGDKIINSNDDVLLSSDERFIAIKHAKGSISWYELTGDNLNFIDRINRYLMTVDNEKPDKQLTANLTAQSIAFTHDALFIVDQQGQFFKRDLCDTHPHTRAKIVNTDKAIRCPQSIDMYVNEEGNLVVITQDDSPNSQCETEFTHENNVKYQTSIATAVIADAMRQFSYDICGVVASYNTRLRLFTMPRQLPQFKFFHDIKDDARKNRYLSIAETKSENEKRAFSHFLGCMDAGMEVGESINSSLRKFDKHLPVDCELRNFFELEKIATQSRHARP